MGYTKARIFSDELKCGYAIAADDWAWHALAAYRDLDDGQGSSFNVLLDYRTSPVPSLLSYLYLDIMRNVKWLDELTSKVEVALITFNPNLQLLSQIVVTFEIDVAGRVTADFVIDSVPYTLHPHDLETGFRFALEILVIIATSMSLCSELRDMFGVKGFCTIDKSKVVAKLKHWWSDGWNLVDMMRIVLFISAILIWADLWQKIDSDLTPYIGDHSITTAEQYSKTRTAFSECESLLYNYAIVNSLNLMVHLVWILKYFRHPRLAIVRNSIRRSGDDLAHFGLIFAAIFVPYTVMANLFFGQTLEKYHTFFWSLETCLLILLGDFDYWEIHGAWALGAVLFFWTFISLLTLILFNMIIGIVFVAYEAAAELIDEDSNFYTDLRVALWQSLSKRAQQSVNEAKRAAGESHHLEADQESHNPKADQVEIELAPMPHSERFSERRGLTVATPVSNRTSPSKTLTL